jgi:hypothetical protein
VLSGNPANLFRAKFFGYGQGQPEATVQECRGMLQFREQVVQLANLQAPTLRGYYPSIWLRSKSWQSVCEVTRLRLAFQAGEQFGLGQLLYLAKNRKFEDGRDRIFSLKGMAVDVSRLPVD